MAAVLFLFTQPVVAQIFTENKPTDYRQSSFANPHYNKMARAALREKPARFDFMQFRVTYAQTSQYDPIGKDALRELNSLAYTALHESDPERAQGALFAYQAMVSTHLANIDVVMQALSLARQDKRFGKPAFFEWMRDGLIKTVMISGDGYTLQGAYDIVTLNEETILLSRLGLKPLESRAVKEGFVYYTMHDVLDVNTDERRTVFVNTTIPMKYLEALTEEQKKDLKFDLRRK